MSLLASVRGHHLSYVGLLAHVGEGCGSSSPHHLFHTVDEDTLMKPLFKALFQGIHIDGTSIANISLYNPQWN